MKQFKIDIQNYLRGPCDSRVVGDFYILRSKSRITKKTFCELLDKCRSFQIYIHSPSCCLHVTVTNLTDLLTSGKTDLLDEEERKRPDLKPVIESGQCHEDLK